MKEEIKYDEDGYILLPIKMNGSSRDDLGGVCFTQLKRVDNKYLFERSDGHYEVITAKRIKGKKVKIKGKDVIFKSKHSYPSGDAWQEYVTRDYGRALEEFNKLITYTLNKK